MTSPTVSSDSHDPECWGDHVDLDGVGVTGLDLEATKARCLDGDIGPGFGLLEAFFHLHGLVVFVQLVEAFDIPLQAPDILGMLRSPAQGGVEAQIIAVNLFGFSDPALLQEQCSQGMAGGLHPTPGFVVGKMIVEFNRPAQVGKGLFKLPLAVFKLTAEHFGGDC